ncbi:TetR/AcrR family transcriptional regulator [Aldersonia kunmingensis]|uniref:TetR/AcrR family transcriptional regulator n=1 Tax=Aldersonia kunmingensis TaxID=408066 RepID=UPI000A0392FF|nr:TetR/AcrR family transcriptional regulator [Aldersonia kunmingensis]
MPQQVVDPAAKPMRADARRNYERIVEVATQNFLEQGVDASLDEIAKKAGVGAGTLYRHFPTRDLLLAAALRHNVGRLTADAKAYAVTASPKEGLAQWIRDLARHVGSFAGLPETIIAAGQDPDSPLFTSCAGIREVGREVLTRAQESGAARQDLEIDELFTVANMIGMVDRRTDCSGMPATERLIALLFDGVTPR